MCSTNLAKKSRTTGATSGGLQVAMHLQLRFLVKLVMIIVAFCWNSVKVKDIHEVSKNMLDGDKYSFSNRVINERNE